MTSTATIRQRAATDVAACVALMAKTHRLTERPLAIHRDTEPQSVRIEVAAGRAGISVTSTSSAV